MIRGERVGLSSALNICIDASSGYWIARMDADDVAVSNRIERQLLWAKSHEADICGSFVNVFGSGKDRVWRYPVSESAIKVRLLFNSPFAHPSIMVKKSIIKTIKYRSEMLPGEDYDLWVQFFENNVKMTNCPEVLLNYRIHDNQISSAKWGKQLQQREKISKRVWSLFFGEKFVPKSVVSFSSESEVSDIISNFNKLKLDAESIEEIKKSLVAMFLRSGRRGVRLISGPFMCREYISVKMIILLTIYLAVFWWIPVDFFEKIKRRVV